MAGGSCPYFTVFLLKERKKNHLFRVLYNKKITQTFLSCLLKLYSKLVLVQ
jgi:hypothetical protein